jgi:hypothetical protein
LRFLEKELADFILVTYFSSDLPLILGDNEQTSQKLISKKFSNHQKQRFKFKKKPLLLVK